MAHPHISLLTEKNLIYNEKEQGQIHQLLDKAFERRFLYKIEFSNPTLASRKSIWRSIIPALTDTEAQELASRYTFSGGQIENIARKRTIDSVISGADPTLDQMFSYCNAELLSKNGMMGKIGFC